MVGVEPACSRGGGRFASHPFKAALAWSEFRHVK